MAAGLPGARWTGAESYHLTLRFVGEVDEGVAADIDDALAGVQMPSFDISLSGVGYFGNGKAARALWAGVPASESLLRLHAKIETAMQRTGLPAEERKYAPHVTLARLRGTPARRREEYIAAHVQFSAGPFHASEFTLFSSFLSSSGAIYTPEASYPLSEAR